MSLYGRDRGAHWAARRFHQAQAMSAPAAPRFKGRQYQFSHTVTIAGETGHGHVEAVTKPVEAAPKATTRVIVRWEGKLNPGTRVIVDGVKYRLLKIYPANRRVSVAHLLCAPVPGEP